MVYRSVGDKIAVHFPSLRLPISSSEAKATLLKLGFFEQEFRLGKIARELLWRSEYRRGATIEQAPDIVDCSSMTKWIYGQIGVWLPRYSIDQRDCGEPVSRPREGDLVFKSGWRNYYWKNPNDNVGHVGIVTELKTVIHAANKSQRVTETDWKDFVRCKEKYRGLRRYIPLCQNFENQHFAVLRMTKKKVETSQELRWLILQRL